jgi:hypothetical protein
MHGPCIRKEFIRSKIGGKNYLLYVIKRLTGFKFLFEALAYRMQLQVGIRGAGPRLSEGSVTRETNKK